jgi:uncharacterized membrane protein (UPF0127 family)
MRTLAIAALALLMACARGQVTPSDCPNQLGTAAFSRSAVLRIEVADDDASREQGLMGVTNLPADRGMAFTWTAPTDATFWMKDTLIPLSIAFVDANAHVVSIQEMTPCTADPCPTYASTAPYTTAIEANAGWFEDHAVEIGDHMDFTGETCM